MCLFCFWTLTSPFSLYVTLILKLKITEFGQITFIANNYLVKFIQHNLHYNRTVLYFYLWWQINGKSTHFKISSLINSDKNLGQKLTHISQNGADGAGMGLTRSGRGIRPLLLLLLREEDLGNVPVPCFILRAYFCRLPGNPYRLMWWGRFLRVRVTSFLLFRSTFTRSCSCQATCRNTRYTDTQWAGDMDTFTFCLPSKWNSSLIHGHISWVM